MIKENYKVYVLSKGENDEKAANICYLFNISDLLQPEWG